MPTATDRAAERRFALDCEQLEDRAVPATAALAAGTLTVTGDDTDDRIRVFAEGGAIRVLDGTALIGAFDPAAVTNLIVNTGAGSDRVVVAPTVLANTIINGPAGDKKLAGGGGPTTFNTGAGRDFLFGGLGANTFNADGGRNDLFKVKPDDLTVPGTAADRLLPAFPVGTGAPAAPQQTITAAEVEILLRRAAAASASTDAIIAIVDRNGRILGVRVESGVAPEITQNAANLVFAVDGAVSKARTGAYFANNEGPLTSRTVQFISQSSLTEREINSNPNITDPNSTLRGPGFVAAVGVKSHFPPGIQNTPQVDLYQIEHTNRDGTFHVGNDRIKGTADDVQLAERFNADPNFVPDGQSLFPPDSYGFETNLLRGGQSRGIATLPGGVPIYKNGQVVGGIGVFFPGKTGFATEENSVLSTTFDSRRPDRSQEAEWIAFAAVGGTRASVDGTPTQPVDSLSGVGLPDGFGLPTGRLDLVGIQLDVFGPGGAANGRDVLRQTSDAVGRGNPNDGANLAVSAGVDGVFGNADDIVLRNGLAAPEGWLVTPHDGNGITADEVRQIINNGIEQAGRTRAAIRVPLGTRAKFVFAVADRDGNIVGLFRQADATIFSIDVAVAKSRNVAYYADPNQLQPVDQIPGVPAGTAFTNRTFRFAGQPRFPQGIDTAPPGPFSQLNDDPTGTNRFNGRQVGARLPASAYQSVVGYDSFNPGTNFRQQGNVLNQNGIVFFPGSSPLYENGVLIGGFGVSGDGVDQDDVATVAGQTGFDAPLGIRADQFEPRGVRLPYQKFNRNPEAVNRL